MGIVELLLIAVGLSMDAFAVSICRGLGMRRLNLRTAAVLALFFGGFQALMPLIGWALGSQFMWLIGPVDHWVAFVLLSLIGANMIRESQSGEEAAMDASFTPRAMLPLAVATSIDALAVGVTFAFLSVDIRLAVILIGLTTFVLSSIGTGVGAAFGARFQSRAELAGGAILILMGLKILLEHLGFLP